MAQFKSFVVAIADIKTGTRHRKDMGDLDALAASLRELGMLQPVGITPDKTLVFGERRMSAAKLLGWTQVPALVFESLTDAVAAIKAERDENRCRKEMTPSEYVELGRALEAVERAEAEKRRLANLQQNKASTEPDPGPVREAKDTRDKVGEALGISGKQYERAKTVVDEAPELVEAMDSGALSVKTAAQVAKLPEEVRHIVAEAENPKEAARDALAADAVAKAFEQEEQEGVPLFDELDGGDTEEPEADAGDKPRSRQTRKGNWVSPDHPFVKLLNQLQAISSAITKALAADESGRLKKYLTALQLADLKLTNLVAHRALIVDGKSYGAQFTGFRGLRRVILLAGLLGEREAVPKKVVTVYRKAQEGI